MSGIGFKEYVDLENGEGFCGRPKEEGFKEHPETHRHCYNDGFTGVYELAQKYGFTGTEQEFLASLIGVKGDGVYIDHIDQSDVAGEVSTIWFTDGSSMRLINGIPGEKGDPGKNGYTPIKGVDYFDGEPGAPGYTPVKGVDYFDGAKGDPGDPGYTPVKGVDYYTAADKAEIVQDVIDALPVYDGEAVIT